MSTDEAKENIGVRKLLLQEFTSPEDSLSLFPEVIAKSAQMHQVLQLVAKMAKTNGSVLILGESGTGKELIASAIHRLSLRSHHPFIAINCSAIPDELLESELFGHVKGAFTGADRNREGYFGTANQGTVFLDEIGDMSLRLQAKLLRVLQEKTYSPIGSNRVVEADVRIIAATNVDLEKAIKEQNFRLDLYYRLHVLPIQIPPLRERKDDIECLLHHFLDVANQVHRKEVPCWLSPEAMTALCHYDWPGNVRQLQNIVERLVIVKEGGEVKVHELPAECQLFQNRVYTESSPTPAFKAHFQHPIEFGALPTEGINLAQMIEDLENRYIVEALQRTQNNKNQAARLLGLNRTTLVERLKKRKIGTGRLT
jgi:transcriptional regulator with PAS, ATPase and Fis domain